MKIEKITRSSLIQAVKILQAGGTIVYPTDTAYALGADPTNTKAVEMIYKIKGREKNKALPCIAGSKTIVKIFFKLNRQEAALAKAFWPGPLSLILELRIPAKEQVRYGASTNNELSRQEHADILQNISTKEIAVRVPKSDIAKKLSALLRRPIISTSANISGAGELYSGKEIYKHFENKKYKPDIILDAGVLKRRKPSTIVKIVRGNIQVLRQGPIKINIKNLPLTSEN